MKNCLKNKKIYILLFLVFSFIFVIKFDSVSKDYEIIGNRYEYPLCDGTFIQYDLVKDWDDEKWQSEFKYLKEAKMHYVILCASAFDNKNEIGTIYKTKRTDFKMITEKDVLDLCLRNAQKEGIKVFVGLLYSDDWWTKSKNQVWIDKNQNINNIIADEIYSEYYNKYPKAFYGWYWTFEVDNASFISEKHAEYLAKAININLKFLKTKNERLPYMISPFMNSKYSIAFEYANMWKNVFENCDLGEGDIFAPMDCIGGEGLSRENYKRWFYELKRSVDTKEGLLFWANIEIFDIDNWSTRSVNDFVGQMKDLQPYVSNFISFSYTHYYSPNNINEGYHKAYCYYVQNGKLQNYKPIKPNDLKVEIDDNNAYKITWNDDDEVLNKIAGYYVYDNGKIIYKVMQQRLYGGNSKIFKSLYIDSKNKFRIFEKDNYEVRAVGFDGELSEPCFSH